MLWTNCATQALTQAGAIPMTGVICSTNSGATLSSNTVRISVPGWYVSTIQAVLSSATATSVGVELYAGGQAVDGSAQTVDIPADGTQTVSISWPVKVVQAPTGYAQIYWAVTGAVTVDTAVQSVMRII